MKIKYYENLGKNSFGDATAENVRDGSFNAEMDTLPDVDNYGYEKLDFLYPEKESIKDGGFLGRQKGEAR